LQTPYGDLRIPQQEFFCLVEFRVDFLIGMEDEEKVTSGKHINNLSEIIVSEEQRGTILFLA
jgi:hypothetical protein